MDHTHIEDITTSATTVEQCFQKAVNIIDAKFGTDYAKKNPGLTSAIAASIAHEFQAGNRDTVLGDIAKAVQGLNA